MGLNRKRTPIINLTCCLLGITAVALLLFGGYYTFAAGSPSSNGTCDGKGCVWNKSEKCNAAACADGWYVSSHFGSSRLSQTYYESVPKPGDKDASAFVAKFSSDGVTDSPDGGTLKIFHDKVKAGEIKCAFSNDAGNKYSGKNTHYELDKAVTWDGAGKAQIPSSANILAIASSTRAVSQVNECVFKDGPNKGEVVYAEKQNCANPLYANFKLLTDESGEEGKIETKAFIRPSGSGDDTWVPEPAGADEE